MNSQQGIGPSGPRAVSRRTAYWATSAAERNKGPILDVLRGVLPDRGLVLEIASGTGRHVAHFAAALAGLTWQPSEQDAALRGVIDAAVRDAGLSNVMPPLDLDVLQWPWPISEVDAVVNINMIHVAPWRATSGLIRGAAQILGGGGSLVLYGPYRRFGDHTAPSNEAFDARLRAQNPQWGLRDMEDVERLAANAGFAMDGIVPMPANNFSLIFRRLQ